MALTNPTPKPEINRPDTMRPRPSDEAVWRIHPTMNTIHPEMIVHLLPMLSARSPAMRAPKKVPAERTDVMRDFCHVGSVKSAAGVVALSSPV